MKVEINEEKKRDKLHKISEWLLGNNRIEYIELLLQMPLTDYRKSAISLILAPYFVNVQHMSDKESFDRIKEWVLKCNEVKKLEPSIGYFDELINKAIKRARNTGIKPLKFENTLRYMNYELYDLLYQSKR